MAENGADVVICQHSHCIGCYEEYQGCYILYGQGNFHFARFHSIKTIPARYNALVDKVFTASSSQLRVIPNREKRPALSRKSFSVMAESTSALRGWKTSAASAL